MPIHSSVAATLWLRFLITLTSVSAGVSSLAQAWYLTLPVAFPKPGDPCWFTRQSVGPLGIPDPTSDPNAVFHYAQALRAHPECFLARDPFFISVSSVALLCLGCTCLMGYLLWPYIRIRRHPLVGLDSLPRISRQLDDLGDC